MPERRPEHVTRTEEPTEHVTTTEARAGQTPHMARYVLTIGLGLIVILFAIIVLAG